MAIAIRPVYFWKKRRIGATTGGCNGRQTAGFRCRFKFSLHQDREQGGTKEILQRKSHHVQR